jgi:cytochrome c oxidase subunit 2
MRRQRVADPKESFMKHSNRLVFALVLAAVAMLGAPFTAQAQGPARIIEITAKRFEFTPNVITLKRGEPVILRVRSADVTHGFFSRQLKIDELIEPGKTVDVKITPQTAGTFTLICDHFCGSGHGNMKMSIVVE